MANAQTFSYGRYATSWGLASAGLVMLGIYVGSRQLRDFDAALVPYAGATVLAAFGIGYRYSMWLCRPPTRMYWRRGWQTFIRRMPSNLPRLFGAIWNNVVAQRFIGKRSRLRWAAHLLIAWGCMLAAAVTFPLTFGWIRFESEPAAPLMYDVFVSGIKVMHFASNGPIAPLVFNVLDIAALMVLAGIALSLWRRVRDRGALALQQLANDLVPLMLLFAVALTGIFLTLSTHLLRGVHYSFLSELHAISVIFTLLYLPFGKFFHIFQRPAQLSIQFYKEEGVREGMARCARCGTSGHTSKLHTADLKSVQATLDIRYDTSDGHYQDICPPCRRKMLALAQDALWRATRDAHLPVEE
ncbi:hypothetical protein [Pendulispora albinea]|uniref:MFS transporter n=1 Tax=Pendulispora albinea TaxID=2741071 RepID=A0ABZ2M7K7_9BACT